ncbi:MAG: hypothetical protein ACJ8LM_08905 [Candidatus Udaeobacter sp.]
MDAGFASADENGRVEIVELPRLAEGHPHASQIQKRSLYTWYAPARLTSKLPNDHCLELECSTFKDGIRRFSPLSSTDAVEPSGAFRTDTFGFALKASVGGRALMWMRHDSNPFPLLTFEAGRLFLQYAQHLRESLGPARDLSEALHVCHAGRTYNGDEDVLPPDIGLDSNGEGERWSVARLEQEGRHEAKLRKITEPTKNDCIRLGLLAAATCNPLRIPDAEANQLTRMALFALGPDSKPVTKEDLEFVASCIQKSIEKKQEVSTEEFRIWIEDPKSSLIRSIERSKGNKLNRPQIRRAMLDLAWYSVMSFAVTIDVQMRAFRAAINEQFSLEEDFLFAQSFFANPVFGGLPLILLLDRFDLVGEAVTDFWLEPNERRTAIIRTKLYYYSVIVGNRRESDR